MDEELLGKGLELNDSIQNLLARHDAIAVGSPLPTQAMNFKPQLTAVPNASPKPNEASRPSSSLSALPSAPVNTETRHPAEDEEEDDFVHIARRHSKMQSPTSQGTFVETSETAPALSNALALPDPPVPVKTTKDQDMIDLLSLTHLSTTVTPHSPASSTQNMHQAPVFPVPRGYPYTSQLYTANQGQAAFNSYVAPWAQPRPLPQAQAQAQPLSQLQSQYRLPPQPQHPNLQTQAHNPQISSGYPPPPWATTPGYYSHQNALSTNGYSYLTPKANTTTSYRPLQGARPLQQVNSTTAGGSYGSVIIGHEQMSSRPSGNAPAMGQKPFVPSYRLFEDLNVLGNGDGRFRTNNTYPSLSGTSPQSMVGRRK